METYKKKPDTVQAVQFDGTKDENGNFIVDDGVLIPVKGKGKEATSWHRGFPVKYGDWFVKSHDGTIRVVSDEQFDAMYKK